jgi:hypothetical protein
MDRPTIAGIVTEIHDMSENMHPNDSQGHGAYRNIEIFIGSLANRTDSK